MPEHVPRSFPKRTKQYGLFTRREIHPRILENARVSDSSRSWRRKRIYGGVPRMEQVRVKRRETGREKRGTGIHGQNCRKAVRNPRRQGFDSRGLTERNLHDGLIPIPGSGSRPLCGCGFSSGFLTGRPVRHDYRRVSQYGRSLNGEKGPRDETA